MTFPKLVGIVNLTPDSFSDGGAYAKTADALAAIGGMLADGADVVDIGAESTRPGAQPLSAQEEWERLEPVLSRLRGQYPLGVFSLDTRHARNAARALEHGMDWINDVSGFADQAMVDAVRESACRLVFMHSLSVPADPSHCLAPSCDPVAEVMGWARKRIEKLAQAGIERQRLVFDPGIGFGKSAAQSWEILRRLREFEALEVEVLVGHSRKSFLKEMGADDRASRDAATVAVSSVIADRGVGYLRVHNVGLHAQLRRVRARLAP